MILEHLHFVPGPMQFIGCDESSKARPQDQDRRVLRIAIELDRAAIGRFPRMTEARHSLIHRRPAGGRSDQIEQGAPACRRCINFRHCFGSRIAQDDCRERWLFERRISDNADSISCCAWPKAGLGFMRAMSSTTWSISLCWPIRAKHTW